MSKRSIVHIEIPVNALETDTKFYADVFGWEIVHMPEKDYTFYNTGNFEGGFMKVGEQVQPGDVMVYIGSEDIDADLKAIEAAGGKTIIPKTAIPGAGWFAWFTDPTGNKLALYTDSENGSS